MFRLAPVVLEEIRLAALPAFPYSTLSLVFIIGSTRSPASQHLDSTGIPLTRDTPFDSCIPATHFLLLVSSLDLLRVTLRRPLLNAPVPCFAAVVSSAPL